MRTLSSLLCCGLTVWRMEMGISPEKQAIAVTNIGICGSSLGTGSWTEARRILRFMLRLWMLRTILAKAQEERRAGSQPDRRGACVMMDREMEGIWMAEPFCWAHRNDERVIEQLVKWKSTQWHICSSVLCKNDRGDLPEEISKQSVERSD